MRRQIEYGDLGPDVLQMKQLLSAVGYGGFVMDEDFSRATHLAVVRFQLDRGLPANGIVDGTAWETLEAAAPSRGSRRTPSRADRDWRKPSGKPASPKGSLWLSVLGLIMLIASISVIVFRIVEHGKPLPPQSARDWIEMAFTWLMTLASLMVLASGRSIAQYSGAEPNTWGHLDAVAEHDEAIRPIVNDEARQ